MIETEEKTKTKTKTFPVIEIFPAVQGEGALTGQPTIFIRLGGCSYRCLFCDSLYAVLPEYVKLNAIYMDVDAILSEVNKISVETGIKHVTLSGGDPCMHDLNNDLVIKLRSVYISIAVETQGVHTQEWLLDCDDITVSPKAPSSGMYTDFNKLDSFIDFMSKPRQREFFLPDVHIKIVVSRIEDLQYAKAIYDRYIYSKSCKPIRSWWVQVCTLQTDDIVVCRETLLEDAKWLTSKLLTKEFSMFRMSMQQHSLIYGPKKRGV